MNTYIRGIFITSFAAILFGLNPLFVNYLQTSNMNLLGTLFVRFIGSFLVFLFINLLKKNPIILKNNFIAYFKIFICAAFFLLTSVFLVYSYTKIPSGLTTVLHFSYPIIITLMSIQAKRDTFNIPLLISIILSICGVILVTNPSEMEFNLMGIISALLSAIVFSIYLFMLNDKDIKKIDNDNFVLFLNLFSVILLIIASIFIKDDFISIKNVNINFISSLGILGYILASAFGASLFSFGTRIIGGPIAGTIGAFEPLTAVFVGILYLNESCSKYYIFGVCLILLSTVIVSLFTARGKKARNLLHT